MKKRILLISIIAVVLVGAIIGVTALLSRDNADKPLTAAEMLDLGEKYLLEMDYQQALVQFLAVIEVEPMNARAYIGAAEAYMAMSDIDNALMILGKGLVELSENREFLERIAELYDEVINKTPDNPEAYLGLADVYLAIGDEESAITILERGLARLPENGQIADKYNSLMNLLISRVTSTLLPGTEVIYTGDKYVVTRFALDEPYYVSVFDKFHDGLLRVFIGTGDARRYGYVDKTGSFIIPCEYAEDYRLSNPDGSIRVDWRNYNFHDGLAMFYNADGRTGFIDKSGNVAFYLPDNAERAHPFSDGLAWVLFDGTSVGYIDKTGAVVIPPMYVNGRIPFDFNNAYGDFSDGLAASRIVHSISGYTTTYKCGYIDKTGTLVINQEYDSIGDFVEGKALVRKDGLNFYIDTSGNMISPPNANITYSPNYLYDGLFHSTDGDLTAYYDSTGEKLFETTYEMMSGFKNGYALVLVSYGGEIEHERSQPVTLGYIDMGGTLIASFPYDLYLGSSFSFSDGLGENAVGDKRGYIDGQGNQVIPAEYELYAGTTPFENGAAYVSAYSENNDVNGLGKVCYILQKIPFR